MQINVLFPLLLCIGAVLCAPSPPPPQANLYPVTMDGLEVVFLDDMSFVNEINFQTYSQDNFTFYVYGDSVIRTVFPGRSFYVGATPNENWHLPFIDFHTFQNGTDVWGIGPINALYFGRNNHTQGNYSAFQYEIAVITNKLFPGNNNPRGRFFVQQPLGFDGTFFSVRVVGFDPLNVIGYFAGFFPTNSSADALLQFGVRRAHFDINQFANGIINPDTPAWTFNPALDDAVIFSNAQLVSYNTDFKPFLLHARNVYPNAAPNTTYLVVVDPYSNQATLVTGNVNQNVPLNVSQYSWVPSFRNGRFGRIVSAVIHNDVMLVGVSVSGQGTGWIDVLNLANLTQRIPSIMLPTNYSDPRALVLDYFAPNGTVYVGMNGGSSIMRIDITTGNITGYQALPEYLHRTWRGQATHEHVYFVTNEQHSKVYRMAKADFCSKPCLRNQYCSQGNCVCAQGLDMKSGVCQWHEVVVEKNKVTKDKGGEIALGIFFTLSTLAAIAGWYMVWKSKRGSYQAVA